MRESAFDHISVDGIENDYGGVAHTQGGRGINPISLPATLAQRGIHFGRVFTTLGAKHEIAARKVTEIRGVLEGRPVTFFRRGSADIRSGKENRLETSEVILFPHSLQENAADHSLPADESNSQHDPPNAD